MNDDAKVSFFSVVVDRGTISFFPEPKSLPWLYPLLSDEEDEVGASPNSICSSFIFDLVISYIFL